MTTVDELVTGFVAELCGELPVLGSALGADGYDGQLGDFSVAAVDRRERWVRRWRETFAGVPDGGLTLDERVDRDAMVAYLRGLELPRHPFDQRASPEFALTMCLYGTAVLFQFRLHPDEHLVAAAESRLRQAPDALARAREALDPALVAPLIARRALPMARGGSAFVRDVLPAEVDDPALRARLVASGEPAARAFDEFADWLEGFAGTAHGDWRLGEDDYTAVLRDRELLALDTAALHERGLAAYAELDEAMREVAARVPGGSADWRAVMESLNDDHPPTPEAMRDEYEVATSDARAFLAAHDLVPFAPGERCDVVPAPVFLRGVSAVAAYLGPPALTGRRDGRFFVPYPPDGSSPRDVEQRLRTNGRASMRTIAVHEAYPGHHWHLSWAAENRRPARAVAVTDYFAEGWALYAERVMHEQGFFADPRHELAHLDARIFRAARIVVDTSLHTGQMSPEEAVEFMTTKVSLSPGTARSEVERYCANATQAPAYLTGSLEIERIRARWRERNPDAPLREFHDRVAGSGALPLGLAEEVALAGPGG